MTQTTKYFVDAQGNYLGGFAGAEPPAGSIEVAGPPPDGRDKWSGSAWIPHVPAQDGVAAQRTRQLEALSATDPEVKRVVDVLQLAGLL